MPARMPALVRCTFPFPLLDCVLNFHSISFAAGNVLKIQKLMEECGQHYEEEDERHHMVCLCMCVTVCLLAPAPFHEEVYIDGSCVM